MKKNLILNISMLLGILLFAIAFISSMFANKYYPYLFIIGMLLVLISFLILLIKKRHTASVKSLVMRENILYGKLENNNVDIDNMTNYNTQQENELYLTDTPQDNINVDDHLQIDIEEIEIQNQEVQPIEDIKIQLHNEVTEDFEADTAQVTIEFRD